ncbi:amidohydrolase [Paratissierella segnis]|uniref:Amidohydrolase n=1 Tax=Paratissierella segnis TaxID=2763679 RepID=A0A926IKG5_9FIRM|nr:amidohydrolase [Paratissierella segnis]MBC8589049.1 amidohydrolase [Paratissierella segnis]
MDKTIEFIDSRREELISIASKIWDFAETKNEEYRSSAILENALKENSFVVESTVAGLETAFIGSWGKGKPVIAFLGEYDALPGLSQEPCKTYRQPIVEGGAGHGCAHHALGTASLGAALAVKNYLEKSGKGGTVRYYGCPAEEGGKGKQVMAVSGAFDDVDAAITWHPTDDNNIWSMNFLASKSVVFNFEGTPAAAPGQSVIGRSSLEAIELMNVGANYLRGHIESHSYINYAVVDAGGIAPNAIPAHGSVIYLLRARTKESVNHIFTRLVEVAEGAAKMTGTTMTYVTEFGTSELIPNRALEKILYKHFLDVGPTPFTKDDLDYAKELRNTLPPNAEGMTFSALRMLYGDVAETLIPQIKDKDINDIIYPYVPIEVSKLGSTDVCDVSWFTPVAQVTTACYAKDTPGHCWQVTTQGKTQLCYNGMLTAAKVMALSGIELLTDPCSLQSVREEYEKRIKGKVYPESILE